MNRRKLLGTIGAGAAGMAGLPGAQGRVGGQVTKTPGTTTASDGFDGIESAAERPFAVISVGTREGVRNPENNQPHRIRVWNDSDESRTVALRLGQGSGAGTTGLDRRVEFPADGYLTVRLLEPGGYTLSVTPGGVGRTTADGGETGETIEVPRARFDCNDSMTEVAIKQDGTVRSRTISTEIGCPPEAIGQTFTEFQGTCGSTDDANVIFGDRSVAIEGAVRAPTPCYGAELAGVAVTGADTLRVTVATTEPTTDACVECVGSIQYSTDLSFRDRVPSTVTVVHRRPDGSETVARLTRQESTSGPSTATEDPRKRSVARRGYSPSRMTRFTKAAEK